MRTSGQHPRLGEMTLCGRPAEIGGGVLGYDTSGLCSSTLYPGSAQQANECDRACCDKDGRGPAHDHRAQSSPSTHLDLAPLWLEEAKPATDGKHRRNQRPSPPATATSMPRAQGAPMVLNIGNRVKLRQYVAPAMVKPDAKTT